VLHGVPLRAKVGLRFKDLYHGNNEKPTQKRAARGLVRDALLLAFYSPGYCVILKKPGGKLLEDHGP